jgi:hypothetical protein
MYEIVNATPQEVLTTYILFIAACVVTYPIIRLIITAVTKGVSRWN